MPRNCRRIPIPGLLIPGLAALALLIGLLGPAGTASAQSPLPDQYLPAGPGPGAGGPDSGSPSGGSGGAGDPGIDLDVGGPGSGDAAFGAGGADPDGAAGASDETRAKVSGEFPLTDYPANPLVVVLLVLLLSAIAAKLGLELRSRLARRGAGMGRVS
jgi:hypothetical protein